MIKMNKKFGYFLSTLLIFSIYSCGGDSLEDLKAEKAKLEAQIAELNDEIALLDTAQVDEKLELVTVLPLEKQVFSEFIEAQGKTYSENNVMVTTDMGGIVKAIYIDEGQYVSKGKTLIQLDNSVILTQLAELETAMQLAKDVYDKRQRLWDQNIGSEIEYLQAKNNYESLLAKKQTIQTQLSKTSITAPISGYIDMINTHIGEMAAPGMPVCQVVNNTNMEVKVDLPEVYLGLINKGDDVYVNLPALGKDKKAKVKSVGQTINNFNRAFQVIAVLNNTDNDVKPNMLAKVKFAKSSIKDAIVIPSAYLQKSTNGYFVFVAEEDSTGVISALKRDIQIGESYDGNVVVESGLKENEQLILKGFRFVLDGQHIEIEQ